MLGLEAIGAGRGQYLHLLAHPVAAPALVEIGGELEIDVAQMGHVGDGVGELRLAQRPPRPVGEAMRLVEIVAGDARHQLVIGDGIAIAQNHGCDLGIDDGAGDDAGLVPADFNVLAGGMENLDHFFVRHQGEEGGEVHALGQRIDDERFVRACHLRDAELRIVGALAQEFGVDRHEWMLRHASAGVREILGRHDRLHGAWHFPAKCEAVRRRKCDKSKETSAFPDSIGTGQALDSADGWLCQG